jgi:hypothetical protein
VVEKVITSDRFQTPSTAALFGRRLAVVNWIDRAQAVAEREEARWRRRGEALE